MKRESLIVLLVSEQTLPNIQFLKWIGSQEKSEEYKILFISTEKMEKKQKSEIILETAKLFAFNAISHEIKLVEENNFQNIPEMIKDYDYSEHEHIYINVTGSTKLVSIATFQFFSQMNNTEIYYVPFQGKLQQIYPNSEYYDPCFITLKECMAANNYEYIANTECLKDFAFNKTLYDKCLKQNNGGLRAITNMSNARKNNDGTFDINALQFNKTKKYSYNDVQKAINIVKFCGFNPSHLKGKEIMFITGGWFEEYAYQIIKDSFSLDESSISLNVKSKIKDVKNEFDVVFMDKEQVLHIVECKALVGNSNYSSVIQDALFKLQAEKSKFGLKTKCHIFTKADVQNENLLERARLYDIEIVDGSKI